MFYFWMLLPVLQILFAIHAYKRGNTFWMYIVLFFPGAGVIIYFIVEYLPSIKSDTKITSLSTSIGKRLLPKRAMQRLKDEVALNNCVRNRLALADAYLQNGQASEAVALFETCITGVHRDDPNILLDTACAYFYNKQYDKAMEKCIQLRKEHTTFKPAEVTSLVALLYEATDVFDKAVPEYESILKTSTGEEIRCRYAVALKKLGRTRKALTQFETILQNARISPAYYRASERQWISTARNEIRQLKKEV